MAQWPDEEGYPDQHTRNVLKWCERIEDDAELPAALADADTKTLIGVHNHYTGLLEDHEKFGEPFSKYDHEVREAVRLELRKRGLRVVDPILGELADAIGRATQKKH